MTLTKFMQSSLAVASLVFVISCSKDSTPDSKIQGLAHDETAKNVAVMGTFPSYDISWVNGDMQIMESMLTDSSVGMNFEVIKQVHQPSYQAQQDMLANVTRGASKVDDNGTLFVYLGGHGSPYGTIGDDYADISFDHLANAIMKGREGKGKLKRLVVFVFGCHSGSFIDRVRSSEDYNLAQNSEALESDQMRGLYDQLFVMSSSSAHEYSWGGGNSSNFGAAVGQAHSHLKANKQDATLEDFYRYVAQNTGSSTPQYRAHPQSVMSDTLFGTATPRSSTEDADNDGIADLYDRCANTEAGADVWGIDQYVAADFGGKGSDGDYAGCAAGQTMDR